MNTQEIICSMALTRLKGLSLLNARTLLETMGSASEVFANRRDIMSVIPDASNGLVEALAHVDDAMREAEREMEFVERVVLEDAEYLHGVRILGDCYGEDVYLMVKEVEHHV